MELTDKEKKELDEMFNCQVVELVFYEPNPVSELKRLSELKKYVWQPLNSTTVTEIGIKSNGDIIER
jgi:hypothetical protein